MPVRSLLLAATVSLALSGCGSDPAPPSARTSPSSSPSPTAAAAAPSPKPVVASPSPKPSPAAVAPKPVAATSEAAAFEASVLTLANAERAKAGLRPLSRSACAESFARTQSKKMAGGAPFAHQDLNPVLDACVPARSAGENIAHGYASPELLMKGWMDSPGHKANILGKYSHIGVGMVKRADGTWFATQVFLLY